MNFIYRTDNKLALFLRCSVFFICLGTADTLYAQRQQEISLTDTDITLKAAFEQIEKQSVYTIAYSASQIDDSRRLSIDARNQPVETVMNELLNGTDYSFSVENNHIVITAPVPQKDDGKSQRQVTGFCFSESDGTPLVGLVVFNETARRGAVTDANGSFRIGANPTDTLSFTFLGYETVRMRAGANAVLSIGMEENSLKINPVVVTALGLRREEKSLGYAVTKVDSEDLTNVSGHNWIDGLTGKVAGLTLQRASAGPGGTARVTLRGESSLNMDNNEALFVVDGVPIQNKMTAGGGSALDGAEYPIDYGNPIADIDPENIESVTILKGAAASALYGARAGNGAIIITTKGGMTQKGIGVSIRYDLNFEQVSHMPDFQYEYGAGNSAEGINTYSFRKNSALGTTTGNTTWAFGPKFDSERLFYQYEGWNFENPTQSVATPWIPRKNWYSGFFNTGVTHTGNFTISGGNGKDLSMRLSITAKDNEWIVPNTGYRSQNVFFSAGYKVSRKLRLDMRMTYYRRDSDNLPGVGYGLGSPTYSLLWSSNHIDVNWMRNPWAEGQEQTQQNNIFNTATDGAYFLAYEALNTLDRDRIYGNISATYSIIPSLSLQLRMGIDNNQDFRTFRKPWSSIKFSNGYYREQTINSFESNVDFLLRYDKRFGNFSLNASVGGNSMYQNYRNVNLRVNGLRKPGVFSLQNTDSGILTNTVGPREKGVNSFYGVVQLGYRNALFLDITGRNDWSSTLPGHNNSYFFPSVSSSFVLSEFVDFGAAKNILSFVKFRASWASVGIDTAPYKLDMYFSNSDWTSSATVPSTLPPDDLKPEMVESIEFGVDLRLFRNKLGIDVNYYSARSHNLIIDMPISEATGFTKKVTNAGQIRNSGWEIAANYSVIKNRDINWKIGATWAMNKNKVIELAEGIDAWIISQGPSGSGRIEGRVGGSLGDLYGNVLVKAPEGSVIVNPDGTTSDCSGQIVYTNGYPTCTSTADTFMGNTQPKWRAGFTNSFSYKNLTFNFTIDGQYGGQIYSLSHSILAYSGKLTNSLEGRYDGLVGKGVMLNDKGEYVKNTVVADDMRQYYGILYKRENTEYNTFSTSYIKLREVRIEYRLPKRLLEKTKFLQSLTVAVYGSNLLTLTRYPMFDPEINTLSGAEIQAGFELGQLPGTRSYGFSIATSF